MPACRGSSMGCKAPGETSTSGESHQIGVPRRRSVCQPEQTLDITDSARRALRVDSRRPPAAPLQCSARIPRVQIIDGAPAGQR